MEATIHFNRYPATRERIQRITNKGIEMYKAAAIKAAYLPFDRPWPLKPKRMVDFFTEEEISNIIEKKCIETLDGVFFYGGDKFAKYCPFTMRYLIRKYLECHSLQASLLAQLDTAQAFAAGSITLSSAELLSLQELEDNLAAEENADI